MTGWSLKQNDREYAILRERFVIGREQVVDLYLDDVQVSRRHAVVRSEGLQLSIEDLASRNGTWLNHERCVGVSPLRLGDVLSIGPFELTLLRSSPRLAEATEPVTHAMPSPSMRVAETVSVVQPLSVLSPREREIFAWLARGSLQREIAEHFGVSIKTIETHRTRIGQKLGLRSRAQLLRFALDAGVLKSAHDD